VATTLLPVMNTNHDAIRVPAIASHERWDMTNLALRQ
jgi:hypothetical protein